MATSEEQTYADNIADEPADDLVDGAADHAISGKIDNKIDDNTDDQVDAADEYMKRFEAVEERNNTLKKLAASIIRQPDQDQRLFAVIRYVDEQQKLNDEVYDLLVEMSNYFGAK